LALHRLRAPIAKERRMTDEHRSVSLSQHPEVVLMHQPIDIHNDNIDVIVRLPSGETCTATLFTPANIAMIMQHYAATGECLSGRYFWAADMVIVSDLRLETIEAVVREIIRSGEHVLTFRRVDGEGEFGDSAGEALQRPD
jgi:hypothetical protein